MALGEAGCDIVKGKVEEGGQPKEDELDKESSPEFDDWRTMPVE